MAKIKKHVIPSKALVIDVPKKSKRSGIKMVFPFKMGVDGISKVTLDNPFSDNISKIIIIFDKQEYVK